MLTVTLAPGIGQVLQLDDLGMTTAMHIDVEWGDRHITVRGSREALRSLARDCLYRTDHQSWDQPLWYSRSAKTAYERICKVLGERPV